MGMAKRLAMSDKLATNCSSSGLVSVVVRQMILGLFQNSSLSKRSVSVGNISELSACLNRSSLSLSMFPKNSRATWMLSALTGNALSVRTSLVIFHIAGGYFHLAKAQKISVSFRLPFPAF